jgi:hypothetical protein
VADEVFLSYVHENVAVAQRLAAELEAAGVGVWIDRSRLEPGQRWREAISKAIRRGHLFIACFSREFAQREHSHMHEEITLAIEELRRRPTDRSWFIPVRLDESEVPDRDIGAGASLRDLQWVSLSPNWTDGVARITNVALRKRATAKSANVHAALTRLAVTYTLRRGSTYWRGVSHDELEILLSLTNQTNSSVTAPFIHLEVPPSFRIEPLGISSRQRDAPLQLTREAEPPYAAAFIARTDFPLHPAVPAEFAQVTAVIKGDAAVPSCEIRIKSAALTIGTVESVIRIGATQIAHVLGRQVEPREH